MITINEHYTKLNKSYLFSRIAKIIEEVHTKNPKLDIIKLGIGDVTRALVPAVIDAFHSGVDEMAKDASFRGYGSEQGYAFLREVIALHDFKQRGLTISADEIIVSDGSKCDVGNFQELFAQDTKIAVPDPIYPVYVDTNVMAGRTGVFDEGYYKGIHYLIANEENNFIPQISQLDAAHNNSAQVDLIYLCFPNNPTGTTASKTQLQAYVDYANKNNALILFDAAYCEYIQDPSIPKSIYEIPGALTCAVEFRSLSKTAGFTGTRCAYTVIPNQCRAFTSNKEEIKLKDLWIRRHTTKFNGVSYPVQKAATAVYSKEGWSQIQEIIKYYMHNASIIRTTIEGLGYKVYGGINAPFIWVNTKKPSWQFFEELLTSTGVVTTPGAGFGPAGEGFIRISAFNHRDKVEEAMKRLQKSFG